MKKLSQPGDLKNRLDFLYKVLAPKIKKRKVKFNLMRPSVKELQTIFRGLTNLDQQDYDLFDSI